MNLPARIIPEDVVRSLPSQFAQAVQPYLVRRFDFGPSFYFIYDYQKSRCLFVEKRIEQILLCNHRRLDQEGMDFFLSRMHPDDTPQHQKAMRRWKVFFQQQSRQERTHYCTSFDYRIKKGNGQYVRLLHQLVSMELDENGEPRYSLEKCTNISYWQKGDEMVMSIIGPGSQKDLVYHPADHLKAADKVPFTATEIKILRLISEGKTSQQAADQLNIAFNTVNTHRRNMRRKMRVGSTTALIRMAREMNLFKEKKDSHG